MAVEPPCRVKASSILLPHSPLNHIPFMHSLLLQGLTEWAVCVWGGWGGGWASGITGTVLF